MSDINAHESSPWRPFPCASGGRTGWGRGVSDILLQFCACFLLLLPALPLFAEAPRGYLARPLDPGVDYNQRARDAYAAGVWTLDEIAAADGRSTPDETIQIYERARTAFDEAVSAEPGMYEAHTYLGYIHRKLGRFDRSLEAYALALKLKPDFVYAIEYQGEAYLGLGDFNRARFNYLRLYALDQALAAKLLEAMNEWTRAATTANAADLDSARAWLATQAGRSAQPQP